MSQDYKDFSPEKKNNLNEKIRNYIAEMPSLPASAEKALQICNKVNVDPSELNQVISLDPVLTGRLLKLINSAYYGPSTHIKSLVRAIIMLGLNTVKNLVLSTAVLSTLPKNRGIEGLNMDGFWYHCLCVGVTSKLLAVKQGIETRYLEEYFAAGLLHDIGKIPLNAVLESEYMNMITIADLNHRPLHLVENDNLGINHCTAGELISNLWKLDSSIADTIVHHHNAGDYSGENANIVCNVAIANYLSIIYDVGFSGDRKPQKPEKKVWETIGLDEDIFIEIMEKLYLEIERAKIFLNI
ncbi:MAG: HDOD domain-containing protein [Treponema sp.]|nr:HDOD domain-containing protein [Treponema sp.]